MSQLTANKRGYRGFSLVELLCVLAIVSTLIGLLLPAIQSVREASRQLVCQNNLRQLATSALNYESAHQNLPPGNLGFDDVIISENNIIERWKEDQDYEFYWKKSQHSSSLTFLTPFLEHGNLHQSLPKLFFSRRLYGDNKNVPHSWIGEWSEVKSAMQTPIPIFFCPSDDLKSGIGAATPIVGAQPVYISQTKYGVLEGFLGMWIVNEDYHSSNYLGCAGAYSGGLVPDQGLRPFRGVLGCRDASKLADLRDGTSNTILYAESLGSITDSQRRLAYVWTFGCLGRGRGGLPWGKTFDARAPERTLFGDWVDSAVGGFGSKHPMTVNAVMTSGTIRAVRRDIALDVWYALCGMADGQSLD